MVPLEDHWLVVHHLSRPNLGPLCVKQDGGVRSGSFFERLPHADHLPEVFGVVTVGEVEPCDVEALVDEHTCVVGSLSFGSL